MDDGDAEALGVARAADVHGTAIDLDARGVRKRRAGEDSRQRAFARAVLADEGVDLAAPQREAGAAEGADAAVMLGDAFCLEDVFDAASITSVLGR